MHCDEPGIELAEQYRPEPQGGGVDDVHTPLTIVCPDGQQYRGWVPLMHCDAPETEPTEQYRPLPHAGSVDVHTPLTIVCPDGQQYRAWVPLMHCDAPGMELPEQNSPEPHGGMDELDLTSTLFTARFSQLPPFLVHEENASGTTALPP